MGRRKLTEVWRTRITLAGSVLINILQPGTTWFNDAVTILAFVVWVLLEIRWLIRGER